MTKFKISVYTDKGLLYSEHMPSMPIPRVGDDVFIPGENIFGWWVVKTVSWHLPSMRALEPTMQVDLSVKWAPYNKRSEPIYDENVGWIQGK